MGCFQFGVLPFFFFFLPLRFDTTFLSQNMWFCFCFSPHKIFILLLIFINNSRDGLIISFGNSHYVLVRFSLHFFRFEKCLSVSWAKTTFASSCFSLEAKCFGLSWDSILDFMSPRSTLRVDNIFVMGKVCASSYCVWGMAQNSLIRINLNSEQTTANEMLIIPSVTKSVVHQEDFIGEALKQTLEYERVFCVKKTKKSKRRHH